MAGTPLPPERNRTGFPSPGSLRLGFSFHRSSTTRCRSGKRAFTCSAPIPPSGGTRKPSVPGRVHSVSKSCGCPESSRFPGSNPFLTRDTVESPAKCLPAALLLLGESRRFQSVLRAPGSQPVYLAGGGSQNSVLFHGRARQFGKHSFLVVVAVLAHHVPRRLGQLAAQRLGGQHLVGPRRLAVIPSPAGLIIAPRKVGRLHKGPGQIPVAAFLVAISLLLVVAQAPRIDRAAVAGKIPVRGEPSDIPHLHRDGHAQDPPDARNGQQLLIHGYLPGAAQHRFLDPGNAPVQRLNMLGLYLGNELVGRMLISFGS